MMRISILFIFILLITSCNIEFHIEKDLQQTTQKTDFTGEEQKILQTARKIIDSAYYCTLITLDEKGFAKARIMEAFSPEKDFSIFLATNPKSRKVKEIEKNSRVTLHYFDRKAPAYVSMYGKAELIDNDSLKKIYWKKGWEHFYNNRKDAYMLILFKPEYLELISIPDAYTGDAETWMPARVNFYKNYGN